MEGKLTSVVDGLGNKLLDLPFISSVHLVRVEMVSLLEPHMAFHLHLLLEFSEGRSCMHGFCLRRLHSFSVGTSAVALQ